MHKFVSIQVGDVFLFEGKRHIKTCSDVSIAYDEGMSRWEQIGWSTRITTQVEYLGAVDPSAKMSVVATERSR